MSPLNNELQDAMREVVQEKVAAGEKLSPHEEKILTSIPGQSFPSTTQTGTGLLSATPQKYQKAKEKAMDDLIYHGIPIVTGVAGSLLMRGGPGSRHMISEGVRQAMGGVSGWMAGEYTVDEITGRETPNFLSDEGTILMLERIQSGMVAEMLGHGLFKGAKKVAAPFGKRMTAVKRRVLRRTAGRVPYTAAAQHEAREMALIEQTLNVLIGSAGRMEKVAQRTLYKQYGPGGLWPRELLPYEATMDEAGTQLAKLRDTAIDRFKAGAKVKFDALQSNIDDGIQKAVGAGIPQLAAQYYMKPTRYSRTIFEHLADELNPWQHAQDKATVKFLMEARQDIMNAPAVGFEVARKTRSALGRMLKQGLSLPGPDVRIISNLRKSLEVDMENWAKALEPTDPKIWRSFEEANNYYKAGLKKFNKLPNKFLNPKAEGAWAPDEIARNLLTLPKLKSNIRGLKRALGDPKDWTEVKKYVIQELLSDPNIVRPYNTRYGQIFVPSWKKIQTNMHLRLGKDGMNELFTFEERQFIDDMAEIASMAKGAEKVVSNPSGTAQLVLTGGAITKMGADLLEGAFASGGKFDMTQLAISAGSFLFAPNLIARMIVSKQGRKWLGEGYETALKTRMATLGIAYTGVKLTEKEIRKIYEQKTLRRRFAEWQEGADKSMDQLIREAGKPLFGPGEGMAPGVTFPQQAQQ